MESNTAGRTNPAHTPSVGNLSGKLPWIYLFAFPEFLRLHLTPSSATHDTPNEPEPQNRPCHPHVAPQTTSEFLCSLCGLRDTPNPYNDNAQNRFRQHARTDWHLYNVKRRAKGWGKPVTEDEFDALLETFDGSISGSDSQSDTLDDPSNKLAALLDQHARIHGDCNSDNHYDSLTSRTPRSPIIWFSLSPDFLSTSTWASWDYGVYLVNFRPNHSSDLPDSALPALAEYQLNEKLLSTPSSRPSPTYFLCLMGGGHFAAMIVELRLLGERGPDTGTAPHFNVLLHKSFHRYTTRRKQGGAQSTADASKGIAKSAGSALRRHNEHALHSDIRHLLGQWDTALKQAELFFIRTGGGKGNGNWKCLHEATSTTPPIISPHDPRIRGFPFTTRRATYAELIRCLNELTRVKLRPKRESFVNEPLVDPSLVSPTPSEPVGGTLSRDTSLELSPDDELAIMHTNQICSLIRRKKIPALLKYLNANNLSGNFPIHPSAAGMQGKHHVTPYLLHFAAGLNRPDAVYLLLTQASADPSLTNAQGLTAYNIAGDRRTRDAFRSARHYLEVDPDTRTDVSWDWQSTGIPSPLTLDQVKARDNAVADSTPVSTTLSYMPTSSNLHTSPPSDVRKPRIVDLSRREIEHLGMSEEMKRKLEREKRARAAELRFQKSQGSIRPS